MTLVLFDGQGKALSNSEKRDQCDKTRRYYRQAFSKKKLKHDCTKQDRIYKNNKLNVSLTEEVCLKSNHFVIITGENTLQRKAHELKYSLKKRRGI